MSHHSSFSTRPWLIWESSGPSLLGYLDNMQIMDRNINAPFMLPVSEKYVEMGTMVMGKIESGRVKKGDSLFIMPNKVGVSVLLRNPSHPELCP